MSIQLVLLDDAYFLRCGDRESDAFPYGEPLDTTLDGQRYIALVDVRGRTQEVESILPEWVYCVSGSVHDVEIIEDDEDEEEEEIDIEAQEPDELAEPAPERTVASR